MSWVFVGLLSVGSLVVRFVRSRGVERQQITWVAYAAVLFISWAVLAQLLPITLPPVVDEILLSSSACKALDRRRRRRPEIPPLRRGRCHKPHPGLRGPYRLAGARLLRRRGRFAACLPPSHRRRVPARGGGLHARHSGPVQPLRRRTQTLIDRRFYRSKYDAAETLQGFSSKLREETDLDRLGGALVSVVHETMQPGHASLWLRPPGWAERPERGSNGV